MKTLREYFLRNRYRISMYAMLGAATIFCLILARIRSSENNDAPYNYYFLIRDLFLAWIPVVIALVTYGLGVSRKTFRIIFPFICLIWLLFFPNAPYLLTDFQHLRLYSDNPMIWFDVVMVIWFVFTGLFLGIISLYLMHQMTQREWGRNAGWSFVVIVMALSSVGMYIGRFLRFNSWDVVRHPLVLINDLAEQVRVSGWHSAAFVSLYTLLFVFIYVAFYLFGNLLHESSSGQLNR